MRKRNKTLSLVMALIFALAFLVPTFGMPGSAVAYPDVEIGDSSGDLDVVTDNADDVEDDEATLWAYVEVDEDDYDDGIYDIVEYGFFFGYDKDDVNDVADFLDDEDDSWLCDYEEGEDIEYNDDDERYEFYLQLTRLDEDETVYYRAYIEYTDDNDDTYYSLGRVKSFDVDEGSGSDEPEVVTNNATDIKTNSAVLNGKLTSFGDDDEITDYGFYYGTSSSPSTKKKVGDDDDNLDEGDAFDFKLTGLQPDTKYYFKAYARNSEGIGYGSVKSFTTKQGDPITTTTSSVFTIGMNYYLLNGSYQVMDAAPYIKDSRTYLPIRYVGYAMGLTDAQIQWYEATRTVILTKGSTTVVLVIGSPTMFVNGQARMMDVAPEITNSRTCLPIAWVASAFGHTAVWNGATQQVTIAGVTAPGSGSSSQDAKLKLNRNSLTLEPGDDATITGTLDSVDIEDVEWDIAGDRVVSVDVDIDDDSFKATIEIDEDADDGDEATITFTVTDADGNEYEADLDVSVEDDSRGELRLSKGSVTLAPEGETTIKGTLDANRNDIEDVTYRVSGDRVVSVDIDIDGRTFEATIVVDEDAENRDEATIKFTVIDEDDDRYTAELVVKVRD